MKRILLLAFILLPLVAWAQENPKPWLESELWDPEPPKVTPGSTMTSPPSDAIVLFDGNNLSNWKDGEGLPSKWVIEDGAMTVGDGAGDIISKQTFGSIQLHIEWRTPKVVEGKGQGRGNSGVFLQETYEVQILDSYENRTYSNGQAASIYKQHPPLVNASKGPGEWQTYDIIFMEPVFAGSGRILRPATISVIHNGVLVQNHVEVQGHTPYVGRPFYTKHGKKGIKLQDHSNPTSFRNIWVRELDK